MVELMIEFGKDAPGTPRRARDQWIADFGNTKVPDLNTFRRNYKKWKEYDTGVLNRHKFAYRVRKHFKSTLKIIQDKNSVA